MRCYYGKIRAYGFLLCGGSCDVRWDMPDFAPLYLQAAKQSENGEMTVIRLSEQDGRRGRIKLGCKVKLLNMLEDEIGETDVIEYKPFEIITVGI